jgi:hypothetical protein
MISWGANVIIVPALSTPSPWLAVYIELKEESFNPVVVTLQMALL